MWSFLESELFEWYNALPEPIQFDRNLDLDTFPPPEIEGNVAWLRSTYLTCPGIFSWPAAQEATRTSTQPLTPEQEDGVNKLYKTILDYTASAYQMVDGRLNPQVWTHAQRYSSWRPLTDCSLYIAGLCGVVLLGSNNTARLAPPDIFQTIDRIIDILKTYAPYSSDIEASHHRLQLKIEELKRAQRWN